MRTTVPGGGNVLDTVSLKITNFPLDYHLHSWQVGQVLPYFMDLCVEDSSKCYMNNYMAWCFNMQDLVLEKTNMSKDEFIKYWSEQVSKSYNLDYDSVYAIYDRDNDVHDTEMKTRAIWKYGSAKGVSGTPTAWINGVKLDEFPADTKAWIDLL